MLRVLAVAVFGLLSSAARCFVRTTAPHVGRHAIPSSSWYWRRIFRRDGRALVARWRLHGRRAEENSLQLELELNLKWLADTQTDG